MANYEKSI